MKFVLSVLVCALFSPAAFAGVVCYVSTPSNPTDRNVFDKTLISLPMPEETNEIGVRALVAKDLSSARELSQQEIDQREKENNFRDIDGSFVLHFTHAGPNEYGIIFTPIDASLALDDMDRTFAFGQVAQSSDLSLALWGKKIWALCAVEAAE
jgi:hypothetical protein